MSSETDQAQDVESESSTRIDGPEYSDQAKQGLERLHPASILFDVLSRLRTVIVPVVVGAFSYASGSAWGLWIAVVILVPTAVASVVQYFSLRFRIQNDELIVTQGILFRQLRTVPVERIQNINLVQNPLHRLVRVAEVRVETASGTKPEAVLRVISMAQFRALRDSVSKAQGSSRTQEASALASDDARTLRGVENVEILRIRTSWLCRAGLASNRGMILMGVLIGAFFQFDLEDRFDLNRFSGFVEDQFAGDFIPVIVIVGVLAMLLLFRLLGIAWYVLRFHGYRLSREGDDLRIACGLFTKVSASIPRGRIQFISIQQNVFMKWMGISSLRIETAGGSGKETESAASSVSSRWFVPVVTDDRVAAVVNHLHEGLEWRPDELDWRPVSPQAPKRLTRVAVFISVIIGLIALKISAPWGFLVGVAAFVPLVLYALRSSRAMRYARTEDGIVYRSGLFTKKTSMTFFDRIQVLRVGQSPFDRRWDMAELSIDTAAAGPAEHRIKIPYLSKDFAEVEYREILQRASLS